MLSCTHEQLSRKIVGKKLVHRTHEQEKLPRNLSRKTWSSARDFRRGYFGYDGGISGSCCKIWGLVGILLVYWPVCNGGRLHSLGSFVIFFLNCFRCLFDFSLTRILTDSFQSPSNPRIKCSRSSTHVSASSPSFVTAREKGYELTSSRAGG